jgi:hypothetical protein
MVRYMLLTAGLILTLALASGAPAHATYTTTCSVALTANGLPTIRMVGDAQGGVTFYVEAPDGDGRFLQIRPGGGHWEIHSMHDLPNDSAIPTDSNGYPVVIQD